MDPRISVVINTLNEEQNLPYALASVRWADEIVVVDMKSDDRTAEIARAAGAKVCLHERTGFVEPARALGIEQAKGPWILLLDADEMVPRALSLRIRELLAADAADVIGLPRLNYVLGVPLMHAGKGPHQEKHPRLFKKGRLDPRAAIHRGLVRDPKARYKDLEYRDGLAVVHFEFLDIEEILEKYDRYSTIEARQAFDAGRRTGPVRVLAEALREFLRRYVRGQGFRSGWRGLRFCLFKAFYRFSTETKLLQLQQGCDRDAVEESYRGIARRLIDEYRDPGSDAR